MGIFLFTKSSFLKDKRELTLIIVQARRKVKKLVGASINVEGIICQMSQLTLLRLSETKWNEIGFE